MLLWCLVWITSANITTFFWISNKWCALFFNLFFYLSINWLINSKLNTYFFFIFFCWSSNYSDTNTYRPNDIPTFRRLLTCAGFNKGEFVSDWGLGGVIFERPKMCANFRQMERENKPINLIRFDAYWYAIDTWIDTRLLESYIHTYATREFVYNNVLTIS